MSTPKSRKMEALKPIRNGSDSKTDPQSPGGSLKPQSPGGSLKPQSSSKTSEKSSESSEPISSAESESRGSMIIQNSGRPLAIDPNYTFLLTFAKAKTFIDLVEFIHGGHGSLSKARNYFEIGPEGLTYYGLDSSEQVTIRSHIKRKKLMNFETSDDEIRRINLPLDTLRNNIRGLNKNEGLSLEKREGDDQILITAGSTRYRDVANGTGSILYIKQQNTDLEDIEIPQVQHVTSHSNSVIKSADLATVCRHLGVKRNLIFYGYHNRCAFILQGSENSSGSAFEFHTNYTPEIDEESRSLISGVVNGGTFKNFGRLNVLSPGSVIQMFFDPSRQILEIEAPIGYDGKVSCYIIVNPLPSE